MHFIYLAIITLHPLLIEAQSTDTSTTSESSPSWISLSVFSINSNKYHYHNYDNDDCYIHNDFRWAGFIFCLIRVCSASCDDFNSNGVCDVYENLRCEIAVLTGTFYTVARVDIRVSRVLQISINSYHNVRGDTMGGHLVHRYNHFEYSAQVTNFLYHFLLLENIVETLVIIDGFISWKNWAL